MKTELSKKNEKESTHTICRFLETNRHPQAKLGDLLIAYEKKFGRDRLFSGLIATLVSKGVASRQTCLNARSFAKRYPAEQRIDHVPDAYAEEILTIANPHKRKQVFLAIAKDIKSGVRIKLPMVREIVRGTKKERYSTTMMTLTKPKPKPRIKVIDFYHPDTDTGGPDGAYIERKTNAKTLLEVIERETGMSVGQCPDDRYFEIGDFNNQVVGMTRDQLRMLGEELIALADKS